MKLINYKRGYINKFDCSIHGTIKTNTDEFAEAVVYLMRTPKMLEYGSEFMRDILKEDLKRKIAIKNGYLVNIRVKATDLIAEKYNLVNYRRGNYMFEVTK
jgi:hypothetical protein